ncbi:MAG: MT-A70 family methyltransferase [Smithella sp.]|jgi:N6-adenosine-specific RNA methylase IME4|nr:MT-A70 family methyltransferase [Smithella sp.]MDD5674370.1 MT-A70 family methyltransferase [Chitinivibrionales bacterium]
MAGELVKLERATMALAEAKTLEEVKHIIDIAEAARVYSRAAKLGLDAYNHAAEVKARAERKAGEFLAKLERGIPGLKPELLDTVSNNRPSEYKSVLDEMNVGYRAAARWQQVNVMPEEVFEEHIAAMKGEKPISTGTILKELKNEKRKQRIEEQISDIENGNIDLPKGKYEVIVVDPPWPYSSTYDSEGFRGTTDYPEMQIAELLEMRLPASDDCVLFLWTTHKFIWTAKELLDNWEFTYRNVLTWNKQKMGIGKLFRLQCEFCLVGIKGKPVFNNNGAHRDILEESRREHSRKPDIFYSMVDQLCVGRKLDIFGREKRNDNWDIWGKERWDNLKMT